MKKLTLLVAAMAWSVSVVAVLSPVEHKLKKDTFDNWITVTQEVANNLTRHSLSFCYDCDLETENFIYKINDENDLPVMIDFVDDSGIIHLVKLNEKLAKHSVVIPKSNKIKLFINGDESHYFEKDLHQETFGVELIFSVNKKGDEVNLTIKSLPVPKWPSSSFWKDIVIKRILSFSNLKSSEAYKNGEEFCNLFPNPSNVTPDKCFNLLTYQPGKETVFKFYDTESPYCGKDLVLPYCLWGAMPLTEINAKMFQGIGLKSVKFTSFIRKIGEYSFEGNELTKVEFPTIFNPIYYKKLIPKKMLYFGPELDNVENYTAWMSGFISIQDYAFANNKIESVTYSSTPEKEAFILNPIDPDYVNQPIMNGEINFGKYSFFNNKIKHLDFTAGLHHKMTCYKETVESGEDNTWELMEQMDCNRRVIHRVGIEEGSFFENPLESVKFENLYPVKINHSFSSQNLKKVIFDVGLPTLMLSLGEESFDFSGTILDMFEGSFNSSSEVYLKHPCMVRCEEYIGTLAGPSAAKKCANMCPKFFIYRPFDGEISEKIKDLYF